MKQCPLIPAGIIVLGFIIKEMATDKKLNKSTGDLGESVAAKYLAEKGFRILARNYRKPWGEIDIVARETPKIGEDSMLPRETSAVIHFVEVKSVSYETKGLLEHDVAHETWRPEEKVHAFKLNQIRKAAESWMSENEWTGEVQVDVVAVRLVPREKYASVKYIPGVILE
jgi:putative endonuclease